MQKVVTTYKVYEYRPEYKAEGSCVPKYGRFLKEFKTKKGAENFMKKSIYRWMKEEKTLWFF